jgi:hypothetical protein
MRKVVYMIENVDIFKIRKLYLKFLLRMWLNS